MYPHSSEGVNKETNDMVYFYTPAYYPLDNFSAHAVDIWDKRFPTVEHAFQWKKFSDTYPEIAEEIFQAKSPHLVKKIAKANIGKIDQYWSEKRIAIMEEVLRAKTNQHEDVREVLVKAGTRGFAENSPVDDFWGIGADGKGQNMIGKIWVKIRDSLSM